MSAAIWSTIRTEARRLAPSAQRASRIAPAVSSRQRWRSRIANSCESKVDVGTVGRDADHELGLQSRPAQPCPVPAGRRIFAMGVVMCSRRPSPYAVRISATTTWYPSYQRS